MFSLYLCGSSPVCTHRISDVLTWIPPVPAPDREPYYDTCHKDSSCLRVKGRIPSGEGPVIESRQVKSSRRSMRRKVIIKAGRKQFRSTYSEDDRVHLHRPQHATEVRFCGPAK